MKHLRIFGVRKWEIVIDYELCFCLELCSIYENFDVIILFLMTLQQVLLEESPGGVPRCGWYVYQYTLVLCAPAYLYRMHVGNYS